jgi:hypothetical protein
MVDSNLTGISAADNDRRHSKIVMKNAFSPSGWRLGSLSALPPP